MEATIRTEPGNHKAGGYPVRRCSGSGAAFANADTVVCLCGETFHIDQAVPREDRGDAPCIPEHNMPIVVCVDCDTVQHAHGSIRDHGEDVPLEGGLTGWRCAACKAGRG